MPFLHPGSWSATDECCRLQSVGRPVSSISAVVLARDEEEMLPGCLRSLAFADEIVVGIDSRTTDATTAIAQDAAAVVLSLDFENFSAARNCALEKASSEWVLFVDADERVPVELAEEIITRTRAASQETLAFRIPRHNYFYGRLMEHGGWMSEAPIRLARRGAFRFEGDVHEVLTPTSPGGIADLSGPLIHFTHRSVAESLRKDWAYTDLGARRLLAEGAPQVTTGRMLLRAGKVFLRRFVFKRAWRDGPGGVLDAVRVVSGDLATMMRLRELQTGYDAVAVYRELEEQLQVYGDSESGSADG